MTSEPNSGAEILDNLQGVMSDAQMGRGDLTYIGAPKSIKRERDLSAYTAVADLIAERNALRAALIEVRDNAKGDSPDMWGRVELALHFATSAKARKAFEAAVVGVTRTGGKP